MLWSSESWSDSYLLIKNGTKSHHDTNELTNSTFCKSALVWFVASVGREVKGLTELLLLQHFSDILILWKIFKVNKTQNIDLSRLVMSLFEPYFAVCSWICSIFNSLAESFCVEILDPEVVLGQYLKPMTCQVEAEWDCYMPNLYRLTLQLTNICAIMLCKDSGPSIHV